jgi:hypothetical protein
MRAEASTASKIIIKPLWNILSKKLLYNETSDVVARITELDT